MDLDFLSQILPNNLFLQFYQNLNGLWNILQSEKELPDEVLYLLHFLRGHDANYLQGTLRPVPSEVYKNYLRDVRGHSPKFQMIVQQPSHFRKELEWYC